MPARRIYRETDPVSKVCLDCDENKPASEFYKVPLNRTTGLCTYCKPCARIRRRNDAARRKAETIGWQQRREDRYDRSRRMTEDLPTDTPIKAAVQDLIDRHRSEFDMLLARHHGL